MNEIHGALLASEDREALARSLAAAAGMPLPEACVAAVTAHLVVAATMAQALFGAEPDADAAELAPVYTPSALPHD